MAFMAPMICPGCNALAVVQVFYGFPTGRLFDAADRGEALIGGCVWQGSRRGRPVGCRDCQWRGVVVDGALLGSRDALILDAIDDVAGRVPPSWDVRTDQVAEMARLISSRAHWDPQGPYRGKRLKTCWDAIELFLDRAGALEDDDEDDAGGAGGRLAEVVSLADRRRPAAE